MVGGFLNQTVDRGGPANSKRAGRMALLSDIPPAEVVTRPMFPNVAVVTVDGKGVRMRSRRIGSGLVDRRFRCDARDGRPVAARRPGRAAAARRTQSKNNLKQIGLALHNYHATEGNFPAATYRVADLKPDKRLSWQTEILPYVEQKPLYDRIDFKKSWEDPANHAAVSTPLVLFINPMIGEQNAGGLPVTEYVGLAGVGADGPMLPVTSPRAGVFAYNRVTRIEDIVDGTSNTIMTSECNKDFGSWAAGGRPTIRALTKKPYIDGPDGLGGQPEGVQVGFADGSVRFVSKSVDPQLLERLVTIAGHEQINIPGQ